MADAHHPHDDDAAFERALARGLRDQPDPKAACPDAETLALIFERALPPDEQRAWDPHVSTCSRCQAHLAALTRTAEDAALATTRTNARGALAWLFDWRVLVPIATTAAVVLSVWIADPDRIAERRAPTLTESDLAAPTETMSTPAPTTSRLSADGAPESDLLQVEGRARANALQERAADEPAVAGTTETEANEAFEDEVVVADRLDAQAVGAAVAKQSAAPAESDARRDDLSPGRAERTLPAREQVARASRSLAAAPLDAVGRVDASIGTVIRAPDGRTAWRLVPGGIIDQSTDAGVSWMRQYSIAGPSLHAGSAPSELVCWIVGTAGTILRTIDGGVSWATLSAPRQTDLVGVNADDGLTATVETGDGATFRTEDGGETWVDAPRINR